MPAVNPTGVPPPPHLMPEPVREALQRRSRWRWFVAGLMLTWCSVLVAGVVPLFLRLMQDGWEATLLPAALMVLGAPAVWAVARAKWGRQLRADEAPLRAWQTFPNDSRWNASLVLATQMDKAASGDPEVRALLQRLIAALFRLFSELASLDQSVAADREIASQGGDPSLHEALVSLRALRDGQLTRLVDGLRELHLGFVARQSSPPAVRDEVAALLDRLEAEREVEGVAVRSNGVRDGRQPTQPAKV